MALVMRAFTVSIPRLSSPGWRWLWVVAPGLIAGALAHFALARPLTVAPRLGVAPPYSLVDEQGRKVTHDAFARLLVVYAFLTASPADDVAQRMGESLRALQSRIEQDPRLASRMRLLTVTVDPERDTPDRLRALSDRWGAHPELWRFLTGPGLAVKLLVGTGFGVFYEPAESQAAPVSYDPRFVLVDDRGLIRGVYQGPSLDIPRLMQDVQLVEREARASGAALLAYQAAHLFLCYPR